MQGKGGFVKLHRKMTEWGWYEDTNTKVVFLHLLLTACYKETEYKGVKLMPGQVAITVSGLSGKLRLTTRQTRRALDNLKMTNEVTIETTNRFSVVTVANWALYQVTDDANGKQKGKQNGKQMTNKGQTKGQTNDKPSDKEIKNYKKERIERGARARTREECRQFAHEEKLTCVDPDKFFDHYEALGWKKHGQPIEDWKALMRMWDLQDFEKMIKEDSHGM